MQTHCKKLRGDTIMARDLAHWNRVSGKVMDLTEKVHSKEAFAHLIRTTLALRSGHRVLDLGCGTGIYLPVLREAVGSDGHVLALDYSPKMVARAVSRAASWPNVEVRQADATTVSLEASSFDAVLASFSISATQDVPAVVATVHRALRPGGRLFAPDMRLVSGGLAGPLNWGLGLVYRTVARWTGVDVFDTVRAQFGSATAVNGEGRPLPSLPAFAPVVMITAVKAD
jgi:ubiquinone/menaquinone biosynthesis C-methylase UbiE